MIIEPGPGRSSKDIEAAREGDHLVQQQQDAAGPSNSRPHQNQETEGANEQDGLLGNVAGNYPDIVFPGPQEPLGPPPEFTPYEAEWFEVGRGDVVSHDVHLNTDGEALYRFLLTQASQRPPSYRIHCRGTHNETRYRWVTGYDNHNHHNHNHHRGGTSTRTETYTERVTDFDFYIDVTPPHPSPYDTPPSPAPTPVDAKSQTGQPGEDQGNVSRDDLSPIHWSVADSEPVYRGGVVREVEVTRSSTCGISLPSEDLSLSSSTLHQTRRRRQAIRRERDEYDHWIKERTRRGLPPWVSGISSWNVTNPTSRDVLKSSKTVRQWADEYCASPKLLKEFVYTKVLYGWDIAQLETAIRSTIALSPYHGEIELTITPRDSKIYIRPSNDLSRALSKWWLKFLSIILFIFPFIWLFKRFHPKGGGRWKVCGGAYALKKWVPLAPTNANRDSNGSSELPSYEDAAGPSTLASTSTAATSPSFPIPSIPNSPISHLQPTPANLPASRVLQTPQGPHKLIGQHEGEWFRHWEPVILRAVLTRYQSSTPLTSSTELYGRCTGPGSALEGYHDFPVTSPGPAQPMGSGIFLP